MLTGQAFRMHSIRAARAKPGLMRQHLTCVTSAAEISNATVDGAEINSQEIIFRPGTLRAGRYHFPIGTAGSSTLLAQTLLPALWSLDQPSHLRLEGGTHNPMAPTMDFIMRSWLPALEKMGINLQAKLLRLGFAPAGGGVIEFDIPENTALQQIAFSERGKEISRTIFCLCANISKNIAEKETGKLLRNLKWEGESAPNVEIINTQDCDGSGNTLSAELIYENITNHFTSFGAWKKSSAAVAHELAKMLRDYLKSEAPVDPHLADQLLLPMALAEGGEFLTTTLTPHIKTNIATIEQFLPARFDTRVLSENSVKITL